MSNVDYSPEFLRDLQEIEDYISYQLMNPDSAVNIIDGLLLGIYESETVLYCGVRGK